MEKPMKINQEEREREFTRVFHSFVFCFAREFGGKREFRSNEIDFEVDLVPVRADRNRNR